MEAKEFGSPHSRLLLAALPVGVPADLNFFLDNGLAVILHPPPIGADVNSYSFTDPLGTRNGNLPQVSGEPSTMESC